MVFKFLANNLATMLAISLIYGMIIGKKQKHHTKLRILHGLFFSIATLIVMTNTYTFETGIVFDCRSVILSLAGMFCGPHAAVIACSTAAIYRIWTGGAGALMGVLVICFSGGIGVWFYYLRRKRPYLTSPLNLYMFGLIVHAVMLLLMLALPWESALKVYKSIAVPVIALFPIGTVLMGKMLSDQEERANATRQIEKYNQELINTNTKLQLEIALKKESKEHLRRAVIDSPMPTIIHAEDGEIIYLSKIWTELSGYSPDDFKTIQEWVAIVAPTQKDIVLEKINKLYDIDSRIEEGEFDILAQNGSTLVWDYYSVPLGKLPDGRRLVMSTAVDVTERKHQHEALKKAMVQAESANIAKGQFLANMSHEIRTPINAIIGFCGFLTDEELSKKQKEEVNIIAEAANNLLNIINDILDFSKMEAGELVTESVDFSLTKLLNSIKLLMRPKATTKGVEFNIIKNDNLPLTINTDPARLNQCLINLIENAIKFTQQGHVHIEVSSQNIEDKPFVRFDVIDTGIGIPKDKQELIFESFRQADGSTTRLYGGTGLGLSITKQLAELLGGKISMKSEPGAGSTFSLYIPTGSGITTPQKNASTNSYNEILNRTVYTGHVLVAEDAKTNQIFIKRLLEQFGFEVVMVENGADAVQQTLSDNFDVIFMDMQMPVMNGYEATHAIRTHGIKTPIIALTANAMKDDDKKCFDAGCDYYIPKPFTKKDLKKALDSYLNARQSV